MNEHAPVKIDSLEDWTRTHDCGSLRIGDVGKEVLLMGWVNGRRDLGGLIFIDLRDREGITQIVFDPRESPESHEKAQILRNEWVVAVKGQVSRRLEGQENRNLLTGEIELKARELKLLNKTETPPFQVDGIVDAAETLRLKYRYLELRRPRVFDLFRQRHRIATTIRSYLNERGFVEVETPFLTKSTPEGARDYLVPSRVNRGMFYALPQSPQLFKQILMIAGFDRYYQIVRCFRDEDLRADRQPEFTQVDLEMSFSDEEQVMALFEGMMATLFKQILGLPIETPLPRLTYYEAMERYGTDRPDIRFGMTIQDISTFATQSAFKVFHRAMDDGGLVAAIVVREGTGSFSRKALDELAGTIAPSGAKGLAWIKITEDGWQSPIAKFFAPEVQTSLSEFLHTKPGDLVLIVADQPSVVRESLGKLRLEVAKMMNIVEDDSHALVWVTRFPLFEYDETEKRLAAVHHPFTAPLEEDLALLKSHPENARSRAYDLVLDGAEIGGGSVRIHNIEVQEEIFSILGISPEEADAKFGFFLEALRYGAPPHAGMALGFDRLVALLCGVKSIREVIAFPKTTSATCPLTDAPSPVDEKQLEELGLALESGPWE
ncbi:MAG: aspartate--tRNA ligase [Deltaproteobacteria bacterium]|nr:aspartate--tRNA ligase [Deltaproteobacteria bacterium]